MFPAPIDISVFDSRDDSKLVYVVVGDCKAPILKVKLNDLCYVLKIVNNVCHLELDTKDCEKIK